MLLLVVNIVYNAFLPLHYDEAYYWLWSKHLALSYFDHPPMIAWMIWVTGFLGDSEWIIRLVPVFCMTALGFVIWNLAHRAFDEEVADLAFLFYLLIPITNVGFFLATPDAPLNLFWALTLYCSYRAFFPQDRYEKTGHWLVWAGVFFGLALLSKYTAALLFPVLILASLFNQNRKWYFSKQMFFAILIATVIFSPVLYWNWQHEWASFAFQLNHGVAEEKIFNQKYFLNFLGGQVGSLCPLVFLGLLYAVFRYLPTNLREDKLAFFFWPCIFTLGFFIYTAMFKQAAANWAVPAYISGIILLSYWIVKKDWHRYKVLTLGFAFLMVMLLRFPMLFPFLPAKLVFIAQLDGAPQMFSSAVVDKNIPVLSDGYANASLAAYYIKGRPVTDTFSSSRKSMFDYWRTDEKPADKVIYIGVGEQRENLEKIYKDVQRMPDMQYTDKYTSKSFFVYQAQNPY